VVGWDCFRRRCRHVCRRHPVIANLDKSRRSHCRSREEDARQEDWRHYWFGNRLVEVGSMIWWWKLGITGHITLRFVLPRVSLWISSTAGRGTTRSYRISFPCIALFYIFAIKCYHFGAFFFCSMH
jgi:hypothetical protein